MKKFLAFLLVVSLMLAFSATAMAAGAPSPQNDPAPAVVGGDNATDVEITPVTDAEDGSEESKVLVEAFDEIKSAESLTALIPDLDKVVETIDKELKADDLVVSDLFGITVEGESAKILAEKGELTVKIKTDLKPGDVLVVVQYIDGKWVVIDPENVVINADGTVSVTINSAAPIAFLTKGA